MTLPIPSEDAEQMAVVRWMTIKGMTFTCIPNHTYTASWKQKRHNTDLGLHAGLPDLLIVLPEKGLLFIEMKRIKNSTLSESQKKWIQTLHALPCIAAHVCHGSDEAIKTIESYL